MVFPKKREDFSVEWFNSVFNPRGITVHDFTITGRVRQGRGFMGTLDEAELKISKRSSDATTSSESTRLAPDRVETLYLILKTLPEDPIRKKFAANDGFSSREISMYLDVFKEWDKFMDDRRVPSTNRFSYPICYYGGEEGEGDQYTYLLILENLTTPQTDLVLWTPGFTEPLPWTAASAAIRQIARFHATGIAYKKANNLASYYDLFPKLNHVVNSMFKVLWEDGFAAAKEVITNTVNEDEIPDGLYERLDKLKDNAYRDLVMKWFSDPTMISAFGNRATICHHDLHSQNLVLRNDHSEAVLFDFQVHTNPN